LTLTLALALLTAALLLSACVDQHPEEGGGSSGLGAAGGEASAPGGLADAAPVGMRVVATSMASVEIMDKLGVDLVGRPHSDLSEPPERYKDVPEVGMPMAPDLEILQSLRPDLVVSPNSLEPDLKPKYEAAGLNAMFLDLRSVDGMYRSIADLGALLGREAEALALAEEYEAFLAEYNAGIAELSGVAGSSPAESVAGAAGIADSDAGDAGDAGVAGTTGDAGPAGAEAPRVLVLMGLPGSYIVATENSYVGSLVSMAGGVNVYEGETEEFIAANTEDMATRDPDVILRAAHALPDQVVEMFAEEFETNDIWKHFRAVQGGAVHDLPYELFGMSAKFNYPEALDELRVFLYARN
jgi:iron complex transport system substrate-binding protein